MTNSFKLCSVGGTFNNLHKGHKEYLSIALNNSSKVHLYLTTDRYAKTYKLYEPNSYEIRLHKILIFLKEKNWLHKIEIFPIDSVKTLKKYIIKTNYDVVLVEPAYFSLFNDFNTIKILENKKPYCIILKPRSVDRKKRDISSTNICLRNNKISKRIKQFSD